MQTIKFPRNELNGFVLFLSLFYFSFLFDPFYNYYSLWIIVHDILPSSNLSSHKKMKQNSIIENLYTELTNFLTKILHKMELSFLKCDPGTS